MADVTAWWGAITGTAGLAISLFNSAHAYRQTRPMVRVEPKFRASPYEPADPTSIVLIVVNRSGFDVRLASAALVAQDSSGQPASRAVLDGFAHGIPQTLAARTSTELHVSVRAIAGLRFDRFDHVSVTLATGESFRSAKRLLCRQDA